MLKGRDKKDEKKDERLPPAESQITAMVVNPELLSKLIEDYFSSKPAEDSEENIRIPEIAQDVIESIRHMRTILMKNQLRYLPQATLSISSKKAFIESSKQLIMATYSIMESVGEGYAANVYKGLEILSNSSASREEKIKSAEMVYKSILFLIGSLYSIPIIIKDLSGTTELSLPFHLASDLVKKNLGYTATQ